MPQEPDEPIRVLVVDDQPLIRDGLLSLLPLQSGIVVVDVATQGQEAVEKASKLHPQVILMDVRMPVMDGIEATHHIVAMQPDCKIVMLTTFDDEEYIVNALKAGAVGYILKDTPIARLADSIRQAHHGLFQLNLAAGSKLTALLSRLTPVAPDDVVAFQRLTEREKEVFRLVVRGLTNLEIGQQLYITEGTVKNHLSNILATLHLRDRTHLIIFAYESGLVRYNF